MSPHLDDHWAARPSQQLSLLTRLFQWKADGGGREVVLLAGAGRAEGCSAAETRLELILPPLLIEVSETGEAAGLSGRSGGPGVGEEGAGDKKSLKPKRRIVGIGQVETVSRKYMYTCILN